MNKQCPNCGSNSGIIEEEEINSFRKILFLLSFGLYDPWNEEYKISMEKFLLGERGAICEVCGYRFNINEKINSERLYENRNLRSEGEKRLAEFKESEAEKLRNYPKF